MQRFRELVKLPFQERQKSQSLLIDTSRQNHPCVTDQHTHLLTGLRLAQGRHRCIAT